MKRFAYEMFVAQVVMFTALVVVSLVYVIITALVGWHEFRTNEKRSRRNLRR